MPHIGKPRIAGGEGSEEDDDDGDVKEEEEEVRRMRADKRPDLDALIASQRATLKNPQSILFSKNGERIKRKK